MWECVNALMWEFEGQIGKLDIVPVCNPEGVARRESDAEARGTLRVLLMTHSLPLAALQPEVIKRQRFQRQECE